MQFFSDEKLDTNNIKKGIDNIFSKEDFHSILELNIQIMGIAKLIVKSDDELNALLPQTNDKKIKYSFKKLELEKEIDIDLSMLKDFDNTKLLDIIKQEYQGNIVKELSISSLKEETKY